MNDYRGMHGFAPNSSRRVDKAVASVKKAEDAVVSVMREEYPTGQRVRVVHHRGHYFGRVVGREIYGYRICVENEATGKISKQWYAHVEPAPEDPDHD